MQTIRWAMIGHGSVTEQKSAPAYQQTEGFDLAAVVGRDLACVQAYAQRKGIAQASTDVAAVLADPNIHAVYIATPPSSHCALALQVAAAGKHCCVEPRIPVGARIDVAPSWESVLMRLTIE